MKRTHLIRIAGCSCRSVAAMWLGATLAGWAAVPIPVTNAGFEDPVLDDGELNDGVVPGWSAYNSGTIDMLNPSTGDLSAQAPEGDNIAIITSAAAEDGLAQVITTTFQSESDYTLTVKVANTLFTSGFPGYRVQLLAGGTVLGEDDNSQAIPEDGVVTSTVNYTYDAGDAALSGQALEIRLLSKGLAAAEEIGFDDVQLSATLGNPVANPGGPYYVPEGASISLNGSGSLPSDGQSLTTYEWDLDNDGTFGDVTTATPAAITRSDLITLWGMDVGDNPIALRVTDDSVPTAKTATAAGIVTLAPPMAGQLGLLDLAANGGINPATGEVWKVGDHYRLVFHSSATRTADATDIKDYNDWIQGLANASTAYAIAADDGVRWRAIGSSEDVDARDNTWTNPTVHGDGHPVLLLDGATIVATNFIDLWDGEVAHIIDQTEAGTIWAHWPFTGTYTDGTKATGKGASFYALGGGDQINQGQAAVTTNWIWRQWTADPPATLLPLYGMTEPLTVVDLTDDTAPTLAGIGDNVEGGPVIFPTSILYTVTFDEAMAAGRVAVDDFESAGATPITIDEVRSTLDPTVFEVVVTPTTFGTVQLQIKAGAVLTDLRGNPLDTTNPLPDDTIISVEPDTTAPVLDLDYLQPKNGTSDQQLIPTLVIGFIENSEVVLGSGNIEIRRVADDAVLQSFSVADPEVSMTGPLEATIVSSAPLPFGTEVYVAIDAGAFADTSGNEFAGIATSEIWSFTTVALPAPDGPISILTATSGGETVPFETDGTELVHGFDAFPRLSSHHIPGSPSEIQMSAGYHLVLYNSRFDSTSGSNRSEVQTHLNLAGTDLAAGWAQGYIRRTGGADEAVTSGGAIVYVENPGDLLRLQSFRTDDNATAGVVRAGGATGLQLLKLDDGWQYVRAAGHNGAGADQAIANSTTEWTTVTYNEVTEKNELFPAIGDGVTLGPAGTYLVLANTYVSGNPSDRRGVEQRLTLDGEEIPGSRTMVYIRNQNSAQEGAVSIGMIIRSAASGQLLRVQVIESTNSADGTMSVVGGRSALSIAKLPNNSSYIRLADTSGQTWTAGSTTVPLVYDDVGSQLEADPPFSHDTVSDPSRVTVSAAGDYLFFAAQFDSANSVQRSVPNQGWLINGSGTMATHGQMSTYGRQAVGAQTSGNWSAFMTGLAADDFVEAVTNPLASTPETADTVTLQGVSVDSLLNPPAGGSNYSDWIALFPAVGVLDAFDDDPDGDGSKNGVENYYGTDPSAFTKGIVEVQVTGNVVSFSHPLNATPADDLSASYLWSEDLESFHADGADNGSGTTVEFVQGTPSGGMVGVAATITGPLPAKLFVAIRVVLTGP